MLLVRGASEIVQITTNGAPRLLSHEIQQHGLAVLRRRQDDGLSLAVNNNGRIEAIGFDSVIRAGYDADSFDRVIDAEGKCILPGFIDAHTHPVWAGDRVHEFVLKLKGATYMEVHKAGGGINSTVQHTRQATEQQLFVSLKTRLERMMVKGTTTAEVKSGYGLDWETEHKMLRVLNRAAKELPMDLSITYLGGHAVPRGSDQEAATDDIINRQLPELAREQAAGNICVDNIDVFCEKGVFDVEHSRRILRAGLDAGLRVNFHADELSPIGGAELAAEMPILAAAHLEEVSEAGIAAMAAAGTVAVLAPTTAYILRLKAPPVRRMLDAGVTVALASDFNPNAFCHSLPLVMHLGCVLFGLTMEEALAAVTINAAAALGLSKTHGSLEMGKVADLVLVEAPQWEHLVYQLGEADALITHVVKAGKLVHSKEF